MEACWWGERNWSRAKVLPDPRVQRWTCAVQPGSINSSMDLRCTARQHQQQTARLGQRTSFWRPSSAMTPSTSCCDSVRDCCLRPLGLLPDCELGAVLNDSAPDIFAPDHPAPSRLAHRYEGPQALAEVRASRNTARLQPKLEALQAACCVRRLTRSCNCL